MKTNHYIFKSLFLLSMIFLFGSLSAQQRCNTDAIMQELLTDPEFAQKYEKRQKDFNKYNQEHQTRDLCANPTRLPIAVHYIGIEEPDRECLTQLALDQIQVLNDDYQGTNNDISNWGTVSSFFPDINNGETCIEFCLATLNHPEGFSLNNGDYAVTINSLDDCNFVADPSTGIPESFANPEWANYINIFVLDIPIPGVLGYATSIGGYGNGDGVVMDKEYFGIGEGCGEVSPTPPFNLGRTLTHELGHYLNLRHIWGDGDCTVDDGVDDTPTCENSYFGCPEAGPVNSTCGSTDLHMNYMDYTFDQCMYMFTAGQSSRMENYVELFLQGVIKKGLKVCTPVIPSTCNRTKDSLALVALYNATDGPNWTTTWDLNQPMNTWFGVLLHNNSFDPSKIGCVDLLTLANNNLTGFIPFEIGDLGQMALLDMSNNNLSGPIPAELANLDQAFYGIFLTSNNLVGCLHPDFQIFCENMIDLQIGDNPNLEGSDSYFFDLCYSNNGFCSCGNPSNTSGLCPCDRPINISHTIISGNVVRIQWCSANLSNRYRIRYRQVGTTWIESYTGGPETFKFLYNLTPSTDYQYQIKSLCDQQNSTWSTIYNFTTPGDYCDLPTNVQETEVNNDPTMMQITWDNNPYDFKYKIKYKKEGTPWTTYTLNFAEKTLLDLTPNSTYIYRLKTKCLGGWTSWSSFYSFNTSGNFANRETSLASENNLELFPNPVKDILNIRLSKDFDQLRLQDVNGAVLKTINTDNHSIHVSIDFLPEGIYYIWGITQEGKVESNRFVKTN